MLKERPVSPTGSSEEHELESSETQYDHLVNAIFWLGSLVEDTGEYRKLIIALNELGSVIQHRAPEAITPENVDRIISAVLARNPDSYLLPFFIDAMIIDHESAAHQKESRDVAKRLMSALYYDKQHRAEYSEKDEELVSLSISIHVLWDLYERIKNHLSEQELALFFQGIERLEQEKADKIAERAMQKLDELRSPEAKKRARWNDIERIIKGK